ncbi:MAG: exodeoxyribonuclease VII large subunit [Gammaproteobacteria bacterium]|nr:MAG: exodeoxyribonuclease VII large subunit [Gammaproteobacteria bacterium]
MPDTQLPALTVSALNREVRQLLERSFDRVWVSGEISNFSAPSSGHWYFTLKDDKAQVRCAMFRGANLRVRTRPRNGDQVSVLAKVSLYEGRGEFQLVVERLTLGGEGVLQARYEALKAKLAAEGLFDPTRKRPLPAAIRHVGVVTSPTGAAIHDILTVIRRRWPLLRVTLIPAAVQGEAAAGQIVAAIEQANRLTDCDVLIVGRGGGSLEDLWPFNEEGVARALVASRIPVISAVGHEVDVTISDLVADERAPTPTAAAERVTPDRMEILQRLQGWEHRLERALRTRLQASAQKLDELDLRMHRALAGHLQHSRTRTAHLTQRLQAQHPKRRLALARERLDVLTRRLFAQPEILLRQRQHRLEQLSARLHHASPQMLVIHHARHCQALEQRLHAAAREHLHTARTRFAGILGRFNSTNPLAILERGYAVVETLPDRQVVKHADQVQPGDQVRARLGRGHLICTVNESVFDEEVRPGRGDGLGPGLLPG